MLRLARLHGVPAGRRAVVVTDHDLCLAERLAGLGIPVAAVVDLRRWGGIRFPTRWRWPILSSHVVLEALGRRRLRGVRVARVDDDGAIDKASQQVIACDVLCLAPASVR